MESKIIQEFQAVINGIHFDDRYVYFSVDFALNYFMDKYLVDVPDEFVSDLKYQLERTRDKTDYFSFADWEQDFVYMIDAAATIVEIDPPHYWGYRDNMLQGFNGGYLFTPLDNSLNLDVVVER